MNSELRSAGDSLVWVRPLNHSLVLEMAIALKYVGKVPRLNVVWLLPASSMSIGP